MTPPLVSFGIRHSTLAIALLSIVASQIQLAHAAEYKLSITVFEGASERPIPCRVHLLDPQTKPVRVDGLPFWNDHFVCTGRVEVVLKEGNYSYAIERGPEYGRLRGDIELSAPKEMTLRLERTADLPAEGWWPGELHVHRPAPEVPLLMQAEDLHVAPVMTWWNKYNRWRDTPLPDPHLIHFDQNRFYDLMAGEDEREGGALLFFHLDRPLDISQATREYPSPLDFVAQAKERPKVWIDIEKPFWWDVPLWLASGQVDSIGLANNHMCRSKMYESEAWGRPRDLNRLPPPRGNGFWTQEIYYQILNSGLRIPPSAGSASGVLPNPVGYNRAYVQVEGEFTYDKWWEGLRAGRTFVSNGPLLRCRANGAWPGHVFKAKGPLAIQLQGEVTSADPIAHLDIVKDGQVVQEVPLADWRSGGAKIRFERSGWFLIRAIADEDKTFRFASTAPFYVEIGDENRRISRASAQFFLDWVHERIARVKLTDPTQLESVLKHHHQAEKFWEQKVQDANAE